ncbi:MAG: thioredoxin family protein [Pseudomonadota bacterium]|jgi:thiol:disulfide interchange protein
MKSLRHVLAMLALLLSLGSAQALNIQPYSPAALQAAQQAGQPVALHFHADWCPTCRAQEKVFQSLKGDASLPLTLLVVNYDKERELKRALKVRAQSTLIVYRGSQETRRSGGETEAAVLRDALKSAL